MQYQNIVILYLDSPIAHLGAFWMLFIKKKLSIGANQMQIKS
jgi:hypothetical protein